MSINENGLLVDSFNVYDYHNRMPQGAIVGITLGWFFGAIGLYSLGMLIIWKCCKQKPQQSSRVSNQVDQKLGAKTMPGTQGRHRKQMFEQNPTLQMMDLNQSNEVDSRQIHLNFTRSKNKNQMQRQQNNAEQQKDQ